MQAPWCRLNIERQSDFRHPGNAGAAAGEDLAIVTGRGDARLINLENLGPYIRDEDIHIIGVRADDGSMKKNSMSIHPRNFLAPNYPTNLLSSSPRPPPK